MAGYQRLATTASPVASHLFWKQTNSSQSNQQFDHWEIHQLFSSSWNPTLAGISEYVSLRNLLAFWTSQEGMMEDPKASKLFSIVFHYW